MWKTDMNIMINCDINGTFVFWELFVGYEARNGPWLSSVDWFTIFVVCDEDGFICR
jgi:hypothetical protein